MLVLMIAVGMAASSVAAPSTPDSETTQQFLAHCDADLAGCRDYLHDFIVSAMKYALASPLHHTLKCVPLKPNKAEDEMIRRMRDPHWAKWSSDDGLMQSLTDAFPCLTGD